MTAKLSLARGARRRIQKPDRQRSDGDTRARWGRPRPVVAWPCKTARRQRRIAFLRRLAARCPASEVVLFTDEADIRLDPRIGPG